MESFLNRLIPPGVMSHRHIATILENPNKLVHDITMPLLMSAIRQEGLLQDETMQEDQGGDGVQASSPELQISLTFAFIVKHWNSVAEYLWMPRHAITLHECFLHYS